MQILPEIIELSLYQLKYIKHNGVMIEKKYYW